MCILYSTQFISTMESEGLINYMSILPYVLFILYQFCFLTLDEVSEFRVFED
jgi:hypothetical protein